MDAKEEEMISLKVLVDKKQKRVVFAEADKDFVDTLLSFLTFPMGTIARLIQKQPHPSKIGCLNSLYAGLENLDTQIFQSEKHREILLHPVNSSGHMCSKLKFNIDDTEAGKYEINGRMYYLLNDSNITDDPLGAVFVNGTSKFIISDDLKIMTMSTSSTFELLNTFGEQDLNSLEEKILNFDMVQILSLLKLSCLSKTPLTDIYLMKRPEQSIGLTSLFESACLKNPVNNCNKFSLKIFLRKSTGKVLYAEAKEDFIDFLLSILSIPLGAVVKLLESTPLVCIRNMYKSVEALKVGISIKTECHREKLISPKIAPQFGYDIQLLGMSEIFLPEGQCQIQRVDSKGKTTVLQIQRRYYKTISTPSGLSVSSCPVAENGFVKKPTTFIVMGDLTVKLVSSIENLSLLNKLNVRISDIEEHTMSFGREEALRLLEASLTSTTALTYALKLNVKNPKMEMLGTLIRFQDYHEPNAHGSLIGLYRTFIFN